MSLWILATFAMLPVWVLPLPAWAGGPTDAVRNTSEAIVRILQDPDLGKPDRIVQRRAYLDATIGALLTYEGMSRQVLGPQWDKLGPDERQEFVYLFRSLLTKMYADKVEQYASMPIHFLSERQHRAMRKCGRRWSPPKPSSTWIFVWLRKQESGGSTTFHGRREPHQQLSTAIPTHAPPHLIRADRNPAPRAGGTADGRRHTLTSEALSASSATGSPSAMPRLSREGMRSLAHVLHTPPALKNPCCRPIIPLWFQYEAAGVSISLAE
jgi:MlaC protein